MPARDVGLGVPREVVPREEGHLAGLAVGLGMGLGVGFGFGFGLGLGFG